MGHLRTPPRSCRSREIDFCKHDVAIRNQKNQNQNIMCVTRSETREPSLTRNLSLDQSYSRIVYYYNNITLR